MLNFYHVARNTFRESIREPIFFVLLVSALFLIGLFPSFSMFVFREQIKLVIDSAMATTLLFGLIAAVLCASHTITREMQNGTVLLLLSKPVHRWSFILAKIVGIITALTIFVIICDIGSLVAVRVAKDQFQLDFTAMYIYYGIIFACAFAGAFRNYLYQASFASTSVISMLIVMPVYAIVLNFIPAPGEGPMPLHWEMIPALILIVFAVWGMGAITVVFSTRLNMVANLCVCGLIFALGMGSNFFFDKPGFWNTIFYALIPNWQLFWLADALASGKTIPLSYIFLAFAYIILYMTFCSIWAIYMFQYRELAKDSR
ncbi:MAG: hypothetical protein A2020_03640 [Lentisphaerae bacterium GWF2_45_14]|nr:MAG: hypothetical protein A2020_03640 [Lentisphaerae bacterium GWF2_45_14]